MKKKAILALIAAMTLSMASVGTVFAASNGEESINQNQLDEHVHIWEEKYYVIDKEAVTETQWIVDKPESYEEVVLTFTGMDSNEYRHEMLKDLYNLEKETVYTFGCRSCGDYQEFNSYDECMNYIAGHVAGDNNPDSMCGSWYQDFRDTYHALKLIPEEGHYEDVIVTPEQGHWEHTCTGCGEIQNSETGEVIKPGTLPEEPTEPSEPTEPEQPTDPSQPSEPSNPGTNPGDGETTAPTEPGDNTDNPEDTEKPEDNQNPSEDTEKPEDNQSPSEDTEKPEDNQSPSEDTETPDESQNPSEDTETPDESQNPSEDTETPDESQNPSEDTQDTETNQEAGTEVEQENTDTTETLEGTEVEQENTDTTENTVEAQDTGRKSPKTGDPANFMYLVTLAGSAITGGGVLGFKRRNRK